jgi:hypothetical protein
MLPSVIGRPFAFLAMRSCSSLCDGAKARASLFGPQDSALCPNDLGLQQPRLKARRVPVPCFFAIYHKADRREASEHEGPAGGFGDAGAYFTEKSMVFYLASRTRNMAVIKARQSLRHSHSCRIAGPTSPRS